MGRIVTDDDLKRQRQLAAKRAEVAEKHGVAVGWVDADLNVDPRAPKLPHLRTPSKGKRR
jgi:hypothetical protein